MATIKAIDGGSIHQIQSGQVIVDLNSVVKELVENSLDAGAKSIEVRFKNQGLDTIEVQDNGRGIAPEDFETVALKHYTSKLSSYEDLTSLETFGFRGEAISSLCALSKFYLLTARAEDGAVGKRLDFEVSGKLKGTSVVAAPKGTTVTVDDLFYNLPVRRKELVKNVKREYAKVINYLQAYACISVGVRFSVTNQMPKGKKQIVFSTKSNLTTKENIANVYGAKTLAALSPLELHLALEPNQVQATPGLRHLSTPGTDRDRDVRIQGHISRPVFGEGRQAPDRQMFFVNSRPCGLPQVSKAMNEVYKSFNVSQSPFIFANLVMDPQAYDVNVSPDKRTIMLHDQVTLLENLKTSLSGLFEQTGQTVPKGSLPSGKLPAYQPLHVKRVMSEGSPRSDVEHSAAGRESGSESREDENSNGRSIVSRAPAARSSSTEVPSLIYSWASRASKARGTSKPHNSRTPSVSEQPVGFVKVSEMLQDSIAADDASEDLVPHSLLENEAGDSPTPSDRTITDGAYTGDNHTRQITLTSTSDDAAKSIQYGEPDFSADPRVRKRVQDLNDLVDKQQQNEEAKTFSGMDTQPDAEEPIQTIGSSIVKPQAGPIQSAFDRMRPKRTLSRTAEITVGDTTTTTVLGGGSIYKKAKVHTPKHSQIIAQYGASPLLARGLHAFALPGSQMPHHQPNSEGSSQLSADASDNGKVDTGASVSEADELFPGTESGSRRSITSSNQDGDMFTPLAQSFLAPSDDDLVDEDYVDEEEKKRSEDAKIARMIQDAQDAAARPSEDNLRRASNAFKRNGGNRKNATLRLISPITTSISEVEGQATLLDQASISAGESDDATSKAVKRAEMDDTDAEAHLSLSVSKADFGRMRIVGQFNLGFVLAIRPAITAEDDDELFIIDQHAADEKYNYEHLQQTVTLQAQRLVRPLTLDLTATEEELILDSPAALKANGFEVEMMTSSGRKEDETNEQPRSFLLRTLPVSGGRTFDLADLEELLHLLSESSSNSFGIPRPKKVQRMLAMRACRSSIMVGRTLTLAQMSQVVKHMGEMEKPWNCPHGRPTMRHLAGIGTWKGWQEGDAIGESDVVDGGREIAWVGWLRQQTM